VDADQPVEAVATHAVLHGRARAACTILAYALYTLSPDTVSKFGTDRLKFTVPCVIYGLFRYLYLVNRHGAGGSPERVLLSDPPLLADVALFLGLVVWVLYLG
jgi:ABC-type phosphate transport system permease subunit